MSPVRSIDPVGQGDEIFLVQAVPGGPVVGQTLGGTQVFTISVDNAGLVTYAYTNQVNPENIWHPTPGSSFDEAVFVDTGSTGVLGVVAKIRDADGDEITTQALDIGNGEYLAIEDDGPTAVTPDAGALGDATAVLDESDLPNPPESPVVDDGVDDGVYSATLNVAPAFTSVVGGGFGTDTPGEVLSYELSLTGPGVSAR